MAGTYTNETRAHEVEQRIKKGESLNILDVRELDEWFSGHIPDAKHIPLGQLGTRHQELDPAKEMIIVCRSGNRSGLACEFLENMGYRVINMAGGMNAWAGDVKYGE